MTCSPACDPAAIIRDSSDSPLRFARELSINSRAERSKKRNCLGLCFYKIRAYTGLFRYDWVAAAMGKMTMRKTGTLAFMLLVGMAAHCAAQTRFDAEAVRLNNRGVAQMGQQFTERAAETFAEAFKKDPKLAQAAINEGIALMALQRLDEAKKALQQATALDPNSAQAWYNLGLAQHASNELGAGAGQLSAGGEDRSQGCGLLLFRGRLLPGDEAVRQGHRDSSKGRWRSIRCMRRLSLSWRGRCNARGASPRRGTTSSAFST